MAEGVVYFAQCADSGLIKIGMTINLDRRLYQLRNPKKGERRNINLLVATQGRRAREKMFHEHFHDSRAFGEWFRPSQGILNEVQLLAAGETSVPIDDAATDVEWRNHARPDELAEYEALIAADRANAARRRIIRNRCRMRGKANA